MSNFDILPNDVTRLIFSLLPFETAFRIKRICKTWKRLVDPIAQMPLIARATSMQPIAPLRFPARTLDRTFAARGSVLGVSTEDQCYFATVSDPSSSRPISWEPFIPKCPLHHDAVVLRPSELPSINNSSDMLFTCNDRTYSHPLLVDIVSKAVYPMPQPPSGTPMILNNHSIAWTQPVFPNELSITPTAWTCPCCEQKNNATASECDSCLVRNPVLPAPQKPIAYDLFVQQPPPAQPLRVLRTPAGVNDTFFFSGRQDYPLWFKHPFILMREGWHGVVLYDCSDPLKPIRSKNLLANTSNTFNMIREDLLFVVDRDGSHLRWVRLPDMSHENQVDIKGVKLLEVFHKLFLVLLVEHPRSQELPLPFIFNATPPPMECDIRVHSVLNGKLLNQFAITIPRVHRWLITWSWCGEYLLAPENDHMLPYRLVL